MDAAKITVVAAVVSGSIVVICIVIIVLVVLLCRCSRRKSRRRRHDWLRQQYHAEVSDAHSQTHLSFSAVMRPALLTRGCIEGRPRPFVRLFPNSVTFLHLFNPLKGRDVNWLHFAIQM